MQCPVVKHNYREHNKVADALAKHGVIFAIFDDAKLLIVSPAYVRQALGAGMLGTTFDKSVRSPNAPQIAKRHLSIVINLG